MKLAISLCLAILSILPHTSPKRPFILQHRQHAHVNARSLDDLSPFASQTSYDQETQDLKLFLSNSVKLSKADDPRYITHTQIQADGTFTSGNLDQLDNIEALLKNHPVIIQDFEEIKRVDKYNQEIKEILGYFNFDWFSEDPKVFTGDQDSYYNIVKKRSIILYYVSRILLYVTIVYVLAFIVLGNTYRHLRAYEHDQSFNSKVRLFGIANGAIILLIMALSVVALYKIYLAKYDISDVYSRLP